MSLRIKEILETLLREKNTYVIPPRVSRDDGKVLVENWQGTKLEKHLFITSSGTTGMNIKSYALSYDALKSNARAVNDLIKASSSDRWLGSLPVYHIGGLSIYTRALLSQSEVVPYSERWDTALFEKKIKNERIQFCSLVPTQLYDLVSNNILAPSSLKAVFVGGDFLPEVIKQKAIKLGWPLYLTFGMTEVCSQLATSHFTEIKNGFLKVLPNHVVDTLGGRLIVKGPSLFTDCYQFDGEDFYSIKDDFEFEDGFFITNDLVELHDDGDLYLKHIGRVGEEIKIKGRLINIYNVKNSFSSFCEKLGILNRAEVVITSDERFGKKLELWIEESMDDFIDDLCDHIKRDSAHILKVSKVRKFSHLPRTKLGKLKKIKF